MTSIKHTSNFTPRPPIVTVLGHVDHGKTSLLDQIRKTDVAAKEFGGITQHIGAYQVEVNPKGEQSSRSRRKITFIDTPGHEAFAKMRSRGAKVADIAILVIAGNDGIMPQTLESIQHIKAANIPSIVAINKIDLPDINIDKIKKQLVKTGLSLEEYGGETPVLPISAKTGQGIDKLLEMILLLSELNQVKQDTNIFEAVVIESILSKNKGIVASIVIRNGSLKLGDEVICENQEFRIRAFYDSRGNKLNMVKAGDPAEILGWKKIPSVGSSLYVKSQISLTKPAITQILPPTIKSITTPQEKSLEEEKIKLILKADTVGTLEAITAGLGNNIEIILKGVGNISESDILLAKTTKAIVVGFHQKPSDTVVKLATSEKVIIKYYNIIYELFDEITEVVDALKKGNLVTILGEAKIIALFPVKNEKIAGVKVITGRIARGDQIKVMRKDQEIGRAKIKSLHHLKEDITKAEQGMEAGLLLSQNIDFLTGDSIISIG